MGRASAATERRESAERWQAALHALDDLRYNSEGDAEVPTVAKLGGPAVRVDDRYRVGDGGAMLRRQPDLKSPQVAELPPGTLVRAVEEIRAPDCGTVRLRLSTPVGGWASKKVLTLVEARPPPPPPSYCSFAQMQADGRR